MEQWTTQPLSLQKQSEGLVGPHRGPCREQDFHHMFSKQIVSLKFVYMKEKHPPWMLMWTGECPPSFSKTPCPLSSLQEASRFGLCCASGVPAHVWQTFVTSCSSLLGSHWLGEKSTKHKITTPRSGHKRTEYSWEKSRKTSLETSMGKRASGLEKDELDPGKTSQVKPDLSHLKVLYQAVMAFFNFLWSSWCFPKITHSWPNHKSYI